MLSEPEPIRATLDDWGHQFDKGERQWLISEVEFGLRYRNVELSLQQRALADVRINSSAAQLYGRIDRKETLTPGDYAPLHIQVAGFTADAARLGYRWQSSRWQLSGGVSYLHASHLMEGELHGDIGAISADEFGLAVAIDYVYYKDVLLDRPNVIEPKGRGWAFDLAGDWQINESWRLTFRADDLFASIRWNDVPYTKARAGTERKRYTDGYAILDPLFTGREGYYEEYEQRLDPRLQLHLAYRTGSWSVHFQGRHQFDHTLAGAGIGYRFGNGLLLKTLVWPEIDAWAFQLEGSRWVAALALDAFDVDEANALNLTLSYGF